MCAAVAEPELTEAWILRSAGQSTPSASTTTTTKTANPLTTQPSERA